MSIDSQRGDTIVEVMFAFAVFGMIAIGSFLLANQATSALQRSLEVTLVREQVDAQAEMLRYLNQSYIATVANSDAVISPNPSGSAAQRWKQITTSEISPSVSSFGLVGTNCPTIPSSGFALNPTTTRMITGSIVPAQVFSEVVGNQAYGIWVQAIRGTASAVGTMYYDFHIRACWPTPGSSVPATIGTVVRLYEPAR